LARLRVALRHASIFAPTTPIIRFGEIEIDFQRRQVRRAGTDLHLTPTEYDLLRVLVTKPARCSRSATSYVRCGAGLYAEDAHTLRVFVAQLRRKIEPDPSQPIYHSD
jgi:two-component system KDP operon response regulator KdpE